MINSYLDGSCGFNEILSIVIVFFHSCGYCENVWVEDDVIVVEIYFGYQQVVRTCTNSYLVF